MSLIQLWHPTDTQKSSRNMKSQVDAQFKYVFLSLSLIICVIQVREPVSTATAPSQPASLRSRDPLKVDDYFTLLRQAKWSKKWVWGLLWKNSLGDIAAHVQLSVLFSREKPPLCFVQRQHRERLTRQQHRGWMDWRQNTTYKTGGRFTCVASGFKTHHRRAEGSKTENC